MPSLVAQLSSLPRSRVIIGGLAVLMTIIIMTGFLLESRSGYSGRVVPLIYVKSWPANRSAADVAADRAAERAAALTDAARSQAYIATLKGGAKNAAQAQFDAYIAAQPRDLRPEGWVAPTPK